MKKCLLCILLLTLILSLCSVTLTATAEEVPSLTPYELAESFTTQHSKRGILSGEKAAADELKVALESYGYEARTVELTYSDGQNTSTTAHAIGFKDNGKAKTVLIGCYFGGYEGGAVGEGASTALSVGTLLYVAKELASRSCAYNVQIAFWAGVEKANSLYFEKSGIKLDKIALYVNLDCVAAGKYDYLYADDVPRAQEDFFRGIVSAQKADICAAPVFKKQSAFTSGGAYNYAHLGTLGANRYFLAEDVPCVNFVSGAWDYDCGLYRYDERVEIEGTARDTLKEIDKRNGGKEITERRTLAVANVVVAGVSDSAITSALEKAESETSGEDLGSALAYYLITLIGGAIFLAFFLWMIFKQKKLPPPEPVIPKAPPQSGSAKNPFSELNDDPFEEIRPEAGSGRESAPEEKKVQNDDDDVFYF